MSRTIKANELESTQAYDDHSNCPLCNYDDEDFSDFLSERQREIEREEEADDIMCDTMDDCVAKIKRQVQILKEKIRAK